MHAGLKPIHYAVLTNNIHLPINSLGPLLNDTTGTGQSLAWLLAARKQWDLLNKIIAQPHPPINMNNSPIQDNYPNKGLSLAWIIAAEKQWDLLNNIIDNHPHTPIDLNSAPVQDNHGDKGLTLAWILAVQQQWDLLNKIIDNQPHISIDLNITPIQVNSVNTGVSFAWLLAKYDQWDLLNKIIDKQPHISIDLNSRPVHDNHPNKGQSLAWMLAKNNQWDLLNNLINNQPKPSMPYEYFPGIARLLIANNQWDLLELILTHYEPEKLQELVNDSDLPQGLLINSIKMVLLNAYHQQLGADIIDSPWAEDEATPFIETLVKCFSEVETIQSFDIQKYKEFNALINEIEEDTQLPLNKIEENHRFVQHSLKQYCQAQMIKGHILWSLSNMDAPLMLEWVIEALGIPTGTHPLSARNELKQLAIISFTKAADDKLVANVTRELYFNSEQQLTPSTVRSLTAPNKRKQEEVTEDNEENSEPPKKRHKSNFFAQKPIETTEENPWGPSRTVP